MCVHLRINVHESVINTMHTCTQLLTTILRNQRERAKRQNMLVEHRKVHVRLKKFEFQLLWHANNGHGK